MAKDVEYTLDHVGNRIYKEKLKLCPFCDGVPKVIVGLNMYILKCSACGIGIHGEHTKPLFTKWNKRVKVPADG